MGGANHLPLQLGGQTVGRPVRQNGTQVFVVKPDQTVELRNIKVDRVDGDLTVVAEGLKEGETVVTDGQIRLVPGAKIEVSPLGGPATAQSDPAPSSPAP